MKGLCIRFAKTEWSKLCGRTEYNVKVVRECGTMKEALAYIQGINEIGENIIENHKVMTGNDSVRIIITDNIREYYTEYFWWISTID